MQPETPALSWRGQGEGSEVWRGRLRLGTSWASGANFRPEPLLGLRNKPGQVQASGVHDGAKLSHRDGSPVFPLALAYLHPGAPLVGGPPVQAEGDGKHLPVRVELANGEPVARV